MSKTGWTSVGELEMTRRISPVAACRSRPSLKSCSVSWRRRRPRGPMMSVPGGQARRIASRMPGCPVDSITRSTGRYWKTSRALAVAGIPAALAAWSTAPSGAGSTTLTTLAADEARRSRRRASPSGPPATSPTRIWVGCSFGRTFICGLSYHLPLSRIGAHGGVEGARYLSRTGAWPPPNEWRRGQGSRGRDRRIVRIRLCGQPSPGRVVASASPRRPRR
jgi:hypothetical protein